MIDETVQISMDGIKALASEVDLLEAAKAHKDRYEQLAVQRATLLAQIRNIEKEMASAASQNNACIAAARLVAENRVNKTYSELSAQFHKFRSFTG